ncbi:DNA-processing protein DprA [Solwaraspora sp. WMMD406]|uniref:DNA-processing protein DprA n=1 Tax=Solwaraspora sp. WMMD406 TaxID=3016095 RepID=UPI0024176D93|nr:DNA-processing protein DprA [Solwaraspora sp. WMMD406]MDG4767205.1 DNA-processing protein DprA [Solwaraspora sp. WMMD406]
MRTSPQHPTPEPPARPASEPPVLPTPPLAAPTTRSADDVRLARIALTWLTEPGNEAVHHLVSAVGPVEALARVRAGRAPDRPFRTAAARWSTGDPEEVAADALNRASRLGARLVTPEDPHWPRQVDELLRLVRRQRRGDGQPDERDSAPPLALWVRGPLELDEALAKSVAVVGARALSEYGRHVGTEFAYGLAERGWTIVSGGAFGVDAAAHRGALAAGGSTVAVLACGVDRPYPSGNAALFDQILDTGLLVSEWPPGAEPLRHRFLIRNRLIAAATAGTVLVEAGVRSGATQTARRALALGRATMVVPGPITSAVSVGCHEILREYPQARLVAGVAHVQEEIGRIGVDLAPTPRAPEHARDKLDPQSARILEAVPSRGTIGLDALAGRAGVDTRTALRKVSALQTQGLLVGSDGQYRLPPRGSAGNR